MLNTENQMRVNELSGPKGVLGIGKVGFNLNVPVAGSMELSGVSSVPVSSFVLSSPELATTSSFSPF